MTPKELADRIEAAMLAAMSEDGEENAEVVFSHLLPAAKAIATAITETENRYCAMIDLSTGELVSTQIALPDWEELQSTIEAGSDLKWIGNSDDGDFALYLHDQILKSKML
jgi:hypothetical protein